MLLRIAFAVLLLSPPLATAESWRSTVAAATRLQREHRFAEAERLLQLALEQSRRLEADVAPVATVYHNLGGLYQDMGRCDPAAGAYQRSIALWEKTGAAGDAYLFQSANHLVGLYLECGMVDEAERHHRAHVAPRLAGGAGQGKGENLADALANLGSIEFQRRKYAAALSHYRDAMEVRERLAVPQSVGMAVLLNNYASALLRTGEVERAIECSRNAIGLLESLAGAGNALLVAALVNGAELYFQAGRPSDAEPMFIRALALARSVSGDDHPLTATVLSRYAILLKRTRRKKEASVLESEARDIRARLPGGPTRKTVDVRELEVSLRE